MFDVTWSRFQPEALCEVNELAELEVTREHELSHRVHLVLKDPDKQVRGAPGGEVRGAPGGEVRGAPGGEGEAWAGRRTHQMAG